MSGKGDLYSSGLKPVYKVIPGDEKWNTIPNQVNTEIIEESLRVQFSYLFDWESTSTVHFWFSYPFGYEDVCKQWDELENKLTDSPSIYFYRELLAYTIERRRVELLTITDHNNKTEKEEPFMKNLFPEAKNK